MILEPALSMFLLNKAQINEQHMIKNNIEELLGPGEANRRPYKALEGPYKALIRPYKAFKAF